MSYADKTELVITGEEELKTALNRLHSADDAVNWVMMGYKEGSKNLLEVKGFGTRLSFFLILPNDLMPAFRQAKEAF